jgi:quercetin dioxygenase-like cupin family protein
LLYLISGKLDLTIGSETFNLESGDAAYFDSGVRHSYHRASKTPCTGVIVTA